MAAGRIGKPCRQTPGGGLGDSGLVEFDAKLDTPGIGEGSNRSAATSSEGGGGKAMAGSGQRRSVKSWCSKFCARHWTGFANEPQASRFRKSQYRQATNPQKAASVSTSRDSPRCSAYRRSRPHRHYHRQRRHRRKLCGTPNGWNRSRKQHCVRRQMRAALGGKRRLSNGNRACSIPLWTNRSEAMSTTRTNDRGQPDDGRPPHRVRCGRVRPRNKCPNGSRNFFLAKNTTAGKAGRSDVAMSEQYGVHVRRRHKLVLETLSRSVADAVEAGDFHDAGVSRGSTGLATASGKLCCALKNFWPIPR